MKKVIFALVGLGVVVSLFVIQSTHYRKQIHKLQAELSDKQIQIQILQADLRECKQIEDNIKASHEKMIAKLLKDFEKFKKSN